MSTLLNRFSRKLILSIAGLVFVAGAFTAYRHFTHSTQQQKPYVSPASVVIDPTQIPDEVKGKMITLKKFGYSDVGDYHAMFSEDVRAGLSFWKEENFQYTQNYAHHLIARMESGEIIVYAIIDNADNCLVGCVEARAFHEDDPGQIGTWLNEKYRGKGRIQEALYLLIQTYFDLTKQDRINVFVEPFNKRSYRSLQKVGFKQVGRAKMGKRSFNILEMEPKDLIRPSFK